MRNMDYTDVVAGALLALIGIAASGYSFAHYDLGTLLTMGPGMFPFALGLILAGFGLIIALPAVLRSGSLPNVEWRALLFTFAAVSVFALTVERIGLIPSAILMSVLSVLADRRGTLKRMAGLAVVLPILASAIFIYGLGVPLDLVAWGR
ncbi:tripartite tricarboxylate transporter TctB family protein [Salipiger abyssi]|uniref:tripartite tricarboxylate transporter TctB family protein n=1 Tax=Salipiger abyssi TaxID=1250539 RepID=UPI001A8FA653|nr:tripartite tricarboxylate transporter TctB family protein [Salipiger abyssi]MBN9887197.1 tripartite tricarboxylate transporter TctB family protein [Salipiger abyssi]